MQQEHSGYIIIKGSHHKVKIPSLDDKNFALFLGLFYGDGWLVKKESAIKRGRWRIGFVEGDIIVVKFYKKLVKQLFNIKAYEYKRKHANATEINFDSRIIHNFLCNIIGYNGGYKYDFMQFPKFLKSHKLITEFLKGFYSTDGKITFYKDYIRICLDSVSERIINQIIKKEINLNLTPHKSIERRKNRRDLHSIHLNGINEAKKFSNKIGFIGKKQKILKRILHNKM